MYPKYYIGSHGFLYRRNLHLCQAKKLQVIFIAMADHASCVNAAANI